ncbi:hypothetical protein CVT24_010812 [Panaeolus cyanescens]|uniref:Uncharacterized protein n=1 Tax=Panaeolus cyanescens TaxID=181874 RepID=A0A409VH04_9AGAR|nr:hypothetical protein CVT24_010812 [Panaeolus cyanescens]
MATRTEFPRFIKEAAEVFRSECTAWTQVRWEGRDIKVRLQAPDIMQQFIGDVEFGKDPEGLLFYNNAASDFAMRDHDFDYTKHGTGQWRTFVLNFYEVDDKKPVARFIARVDTNKYPIPGESFARGKGRWSKFPAATAQTTAVRGEGRNRLYLQFPALRKYVYFQTSSSQAIEEKPGVVIFKDYDMLQDTVNNRAVVADYANDRIVFHTEGDKSTVVALYIPNEPLVVGSAGARPPSTTWRPFDPSTFATTKLLEDVDEAEA